jgi:hypothetical protein
LHPYQPYQAHLLSSKTEQPTQFASKFPQTLKNSYRDTELRAITAQALKTILTLKQPGESPKVLRINHYDKQTREKYTGLKEISRESFSKQKV